MTTESNKSAGSLLTEALSHVSSLMRKEVDLARAEVNENLKHAGVAIGQMASNLFVRAVNHRHLTFHEAF